MLGERATSLYNHAVAGVQERIGARIAVHEIEVHEDEFGYWRKFEEERQRRGK